VNATSDDALMARVTAADADALDELFRRYHGRVHALCVRLVDRSNADDLVQETFLRVLRFAHKFERRAAFKTWLFRIACNVCATHHAKEMRRAEPMLDREYEDSPSDARRDLLEGALQRLSPTLREALVLSRWHDLPYREIAQALQCTESAARVRVHRALTELRTIVRQLEANDE
jgi:RNA polymerase sigma-70 factor (ECF subfamily)